MAILQSIKDLIMPAAHTKITRERDKIKPFNGSHSDRGIFTYADDGFTIEQGGALKKIRWAAVNKLTAYKKDLFTYDEICLDILHDGAKITISEETPGWHFFVKKTKHVYKGLDKDWDAKIVYPSFATNLTVIYEKQA